MRFSVVIPTFNELPRLLECLHGLEQQRYPRDQFEIVVVDDGSTDGTAESLRDFKRKTTLQLTCLSQENRGPAAARNAGIAVAKGELIASLDSDCVPEPDWLAEFLKGFSEERIAGVGGVCHLRPPTMVNRYLMHYRIFQPKVRQGRVVYIVTGNCCFRRNALVEVGGFNECIRKPGGEEPELCHRLLTKGYELKFNPRCAVTATGSRTVAEFARTFYWYGRGLHDVARRCGGAFWTSKSLRLWRVVQVAAGPLTVGVMTMHLWLRGQPVRQALALSSLRYIHLLAYAIGYLRA